MYLWPVVRRLAQRWLRWVQRSRWKITCRLPRKILRSEWGQPGCDPGRSCYPQAWPQCCLRRSLVIHSTIAKRSWNLWHWLHHTQAKPQPHHDSIYLFCGVSSLSLSLSLSRIIYLRSGNSAIAFLPRWKRKPQWSEQEEKSEPKMVSVPVSQICALIILPSTGMFLVANSTPAVIEWVSRPRERRERSPIVDLVSGLNSLRVYLDNRFDFPTSLSPIKTTEHQQKQILASSSSTSTSTLVFVRLNKELMVGWCKQRGKPLYNKSWSASSGLGASISLIFWLIFWLVFFLSQTKAV